MTVTSFACYYVMTILALRRNIFLGLVLSVVTRPLIASTTVMDISFPSSGSSDELTYNYTVQFNNGTTASILLSEMASIILTPPVKVSMLESQDCLFPPFLQLNSKITYKHEGQFHKDS